MSDSGNTRSVLNGLTGAALDGESKRNETGRDEIRTQKREKPRNEGQKCLETSIISLA